VKGVEVGLPKCVHFHVANSTLAHELAGRGITVNTVSPGFTETDQLNPQNKAARAQLSPFQRVGQPEDIAEVVAFLISEEARWLTGQNIRATGGWVM
jgi:3-oxoacyl-[acyl-carrier protein] reductase